MSRPDIVSVLAGGWSTEALDLARLPGFVIAANEWGVLSPRIDAIVSMDRLWAEARWEHLCRLARPTWMRLACLKNLPDRPAWLNIYECDWRTSGPSDQPGSLNGTSSGMVALNLAYQMGPERVILFGFDMGRSPTGKIYGHPPYPWRPNGGTSNGKYTEWARQFGPVAKAFKAAGIEVLNASPASRIPAFRKVDPKTVLT